MYEAIGCSEAFERRFEPSDGVGERPLTSLISSVLSFYGDCPADGLADEYGDMLLFQYGTYDWSAGPSFEIDIVRQFIEAERDGEEDVMSQFHLTRFYSPSKELEGLGAGSKWCESQSELAEFTRLIMAQPSLAAAENAVQIRTEARWELV